MRLNLSNEDVSVSTRKIAVLGANSFSGQDLVDLLLDNPDNRVIGVSRSKERSEVFLKYKRRKDLSAYKYYKLNMNKDMPAILDLFDSERPEFIVNFAAQSEVGPSWEHPEHWFETNSVALAKLVNHLRKQEYLEKYVHISSPEVYGTCVGRVTEEAPLNPSTPYAVSKAAADMLLSVYHKQFGFPVAWVRSTNVYGAGQQLFKIIPRTVIYLKLGKKIQLHGGGAAVKSYIHIRDISRGELAVLEKGRAGQIYHLSPDKGVSIKDMVRLICERMGHDFEQSAVAVDERPGQDAAYVIDSTRARTEFNWKPDISLEDGLSEVVEWLQQYWHRIKNEQLEYVHKP